jgi:hypothetical protein
VPAAAVLKFGVGRLLFLCPLSLKRILSGIAFAELPDHPPKPIVFSAFHYLERG